MTRSQYRQSGVLPYIWTPRGLELLLITSLKKQRWIVPKGLVEPGMTPRESAENEAFEEAGLAGALDLEPLGEWHRSKWGMSCVVEIYPMRVTHQLLRWPEQGLRQQRWVERDEALGMVSSAQLRDIIRRLVATK